MKHRLLALSLAATLSAACRTEAPAPSRSPSLEVSIAALSLAGVGDVVWDVEVVNGRAPTPDTVWQRRLSSSAYGDGAGSASYVGPCDADPAVAGHTVRVWVVGVYSSPVTSLGAFARGAPGGAAGPALAFHNPTAAAPLEREVVCQPDADVPVRFDVALLRPAAQGFFDVAVSFDDVFCSAKLDCVDSAGQPLRLLFSPDGGGRVPTAVLAFACTGGVAADTHLWLDRPELTCAGTTRELPVDQDQPGNVFAANPEGPLLQLALYRGHEDLTDPATGASLAKLYANAAFALDALPAGTTCSLHAAATASARAWDARTSPEGTYPILTWTAPLLADDTGFTCGHLALDASSPPAPAGVHTSYLFAPRTFDFGLTRAPGEADLRVIRSASVCGDATCASDETAASCPADCLAACPDGFWSPACDTPCAAPPTCLGAVTCDRATGEALTCAACADGAWGAACQLTCPPGDCATGVACDQASATLTACASCDAGFWGALCAEPCVLAHCAGVVTCDFATGAPSACSECAAGWSGPLCDDDWALPGWAMRAPVDLSAIAVAQAGVDHVQVAVDVDAPCYGTKLPKALYHFPFSEGAGGYTDSRDGFGGFAPLAHGATFGAGHEGSGLSLGGGGAYLDLQDVVPANHTLSLAAWFKPAAIPASGYPPIVSAWGTTGQPGGEVYLLTLSQPAACNPPVASGVRLMGKVHPVGQSEHSRCSATVLAPDRWYFAVLTYNTRFERLYVDGAQEVFHDYGAASTLEAASAVRLGLNRDLATSFTGAVDDVALFHGVLDETDVAALMAPACRRDLADLRFVDPATGAALPHWAESHHRVWVRVPASAIGHTVHLYFGHPSAPSASDGRATFDAFEDFSAALSPAAWTLAPGCGATDPPVLAYGKLRATAACGLLTSTATYDGLRRAAKVDVWKDGPDAFTCSDARLGWVTANKYGFLRYDLDWVGHGGATMLPTCSNGDAAGDIASFNLGTLGFAQGYTGAFAYLATWDNVHGVNLTASPGYFMVEEPKGPLQLVVAGHAGTPRYYDNLRAGISYGGAATVGPPCSRVGGCEQYRWVDLGAMTQPVQLGTCPNSSGTSAACDATNLGRRVHIFPSSTNPTAFMRLASEAGVSGSAPGGTGYAYTLSADAVTLGWTAHAKGGCTGVSTALVNLTHVFECQQVDAP